MVADGQALRIGPVFLRVNLAGVWSPSASFCNHWLTKQLMLPILSFQEPTI